MRIIVRLALVLVLAVSVAACPSDSPSSPSSNNGSGTGGSSGGGSGGGSDDGGADDSGGGGGNDASQSTATATLGNGDAFNGCQITAFPPNESPGGFLNIGARDPASGLTLAFIVFARVGTFQIGGNSPENASLTRNSTVTGATEDVRWIAGGGSGGSGTVRVDTLTDTRATGTFSFTLVPDPATSATGNRSVRNGVFDVTFATTGANIPVSC